MNFVILKGKLQSEVEIKNTKNNKEFATFTIVYTNAENEKHCFDVKAFQALDVCTKIKRDDEIIVAGSLQQNTYNKVAIIAKDIVVVKQQDDKEEREIYSRNPMSFTY